MRNDPVACAIVIGLAVYAGLRSLSPSDAGGPRLVLALVAAIATGLFTGMVLTR